MWWANHLDTFIIEIISHSDSRVYMKGQEIDKRPTTMGVVQKANKKI